MAILQPSALAFDVVNLS